MLKRKVLLLSAVLILVLSFVPEEVAAGSYQRTLDLCITMVGFCFKYQFRVSISYSAPSVAAQGDLITVGVKIVYVADLVNRGPLGLTRVGVYLTSEPGAPPVSSWDENPPTLIVGSQYSREFKLDLTQVEPRQYYLGLVWAIGSGLSWNTLDRDRDGVERQMSLDLRPGLDTDGDGLFDPVELRIGTNPKNPDTDGDGLNDADEVRNYRTDPLTGDTDGDGLSDWDEAKVHGTDPRLKDTDGDGLSDGEEVQNHRTNPLARDSDRDGLDDGSEIAKGTNPNVADTDGDRVDDGDEVYIHRTDPLLKDTDGDGLDDGTEIAKGMNPKASDSDGDGLNDMDEVSKYPTDPTKPDTDGDGLGDGDEIEMGTNPMVPDSDGDGLGDGQEVARSTSPLKADTDGDSWNDSNDIQPLDALIPNVLVIAVVLTAVLGAWGLLLRRRKA